MRQDSSRFPGRVSLSYTRETSTLTEGWPYLWLIALEAEPPHGDPPTTEPMASVTVNGPSSHRKIPWRAKKTNNLCCQELLDRSDCGRAPPGKVPAAGDPPSMFHWATPDKHPPGSGPPAISSLSALRRVDPAAREPATDPPTCGPEPPGAHEPTAFLRMQVGSKSDLPGTMSVRITGECSSHQPEGAQPSQMRTRRRGPPGLRSQSYISLSAITWRGIPLVNQSETVQQEAARIQPKSRKIKPWL